MTPAAARAAADAAEGEKRARMAAHVKRCEEHVRSAVAHAALAGDRSVKVDPPPLSSPWALALGYTATWGDYADTGPAALRAEGYAVRWTYTGALEVIWAPMGRCRRTLWNWGIL